MQTETTNQKPAILVQTPGAGPKCKKNECGSKAMKANFRRYKAAGGSNSLKVYAESLSQAGDKIARGWLMRKEGLDLSGHRPQRKVNPKRMKKSSDHISKGQGRCGKARLPMRQVQFSFKVA